MAKGLGIVLVSFGHLRNGDGQSVWLPVLDGPIDAVYLFHMPLFFFLGGLVFSARRPFPQFLARKARTLLVPYYVFSLYFLAKPLALLLAPGLARVFKTGHDYSMGRDFYDVLVNGNGLWFLWAYFVGELVTYGIVKLVRSRSYDAGIGLLLIACYLAVVHVLPGLQLPFRMLQGVEVAGFMLLGLAARNLLLPLRRGTSTALLFAGAVAVYVACVLAAVPKQPGIGSPSEWFAVLGMFAGVAGCVFLSMLIGRSRVLEYVGRHSIVFYALNALMLNAAKLAVFRVLHVNGAALPAAGQWVVGVIVTVLAMLFMAVADLFVQRWMWWSIGAARPAGKRVRGAHVR
ncbi:MAG: acyltransferase family protein [Bifidobacterium tibiigranuli]|uniref:acyltransferase family protein n=1 Tax=Bifidobacterium tibiigranuli TaxID=2172043 RepID=UPI0023520060|nr:acyltransferase family protein [Bifidobacterium tibiigranuli]MCH4203381.1 acyltransferase family protein [Bifidobacterium tibiigranuli]MCH4274007.1 acyltransferase family protein [Bifidobacterium tibiigranuli]